ncbi:MAG: redoxin domain-containing protein [Planctomycetaceae bacterium]|nr:redoxin domain-containing protein [Planctomycetaceae bacterium]
MNGFARLLCFGLVLTCVSPAFAQEAEEKPVPEDVSAPPEETTPAEGHSLHGEVFNEGARQAAYLMQGTGNVHFEATCANETVQQFIDQGVGQLHGFWYFESERTFRQAAALDPECAIAYWGMALSNRGNESRGRGFIEEAMKRREKATKREQRHIEAWSAFFKERDKEKQKDQRDWNKKRHEALIKAYEKLLHEFPDDLEAKALLCLILYESKSKDVPISSYYAVDALLNDVLDKNPLHPCHHFRIHLWDYEEPENALNSAALCGESAPAIAHMWHMPGHIYSRLHRYHDAVWQQEASARVDHAHMMRDRVMPDQIHNFAHNNEWLIRNLIFLGDADRALQLALNMSDLPRHPKYNTLSKRGSAYYGRLRLFQALEEFELWERALQLEQLGYLEPSDDAAEQVKQKRFLAVANFRLGNVDAGQATLDELTAELEAVKEKQEAAGEEAKKKAEEEEKDEKAVKSLVDAAKRKFGEEIRRLEPVVHELRGYSHWANDENKEALEAFKKDTRLSKSVLAEAQLKAGELDEALKTLRKNVTDHDKEVIPLAHLAFALWQADKPEEAKAEFKKVHELSSAITLSVPLFARLAPIAASMELPEDWRKPLERPADFGERPELGELGPFQWTPSPAPEWALADHVGNQHSLAEYKGRPVVVIFYLGHACLHCAEQLQAFAPQTEAFRKQGIELVAISTDSIEDLKLSQEKYGEEEFPFPLVSNESLEIFKAYRCYDDFENLTLHGTFLINAQGEVCWQDISYEPFMEPEFVLNEAKRLLHLIEAPTQPEATVQTVP